MLDMTVLDIIMLGLFSLACYLVVYHHVFYPLLLKYVAKRFNLVPPIIAKRSYVASSADKHLNRFSIIIPAFNEEKFIADKLHNLSMLDYPRDKYEVILLCDGCRDQTYQVANDTLQTLDCQELDLQIFNFANNRGKVAVLKDGISMIKFENIVLSDVSALLPINALLMLDAHFVNGTIGAVSGAYQFANKGSEGEQKYWQYQTLLKARESSVASVLGAHGAFYALRKKCYQEIPLDTINDDFLIPMNVIKQGYRVAYESRVAAVELEKVNLSQDMNRRLRIAAGNFQQLVYLLPLLAPKYGWNAFNFASGKALRAIIPFMLITIILTNVYLLPLHWFFIFLLVLQLLIYGCVFYTNLIGLPPKNKLFSLLCYLVNGYWTGLVGSMKYMLGLQQKIWTKN
jgi:cellulose synthase/poly-beta-1,6-N-acetylglucosamine synthase-like glycosyltransferase